MFNRSIRLFRLWGIPVELNISWVLILILVTWTFATNYFPQYYPGVFSPSRAWILSFFTALLLFVSILLHEFSHSLVAVRSGLPINKITLFMFGGVAQMSREVDNPSLEFRMAAAGPLMTLLLIIVMYALGILLGRVIFMAALLKTVASINAGIFLFNMFPGFPLDGGRILRAVLWRRQGSILRATRTASRIGIVFAYGLIIFGALNLIITQEGVGNLWMVLIGFFLRQAARTSYDSVLYRSLLKNLRVSDFVSPGILAVDPRLDLQSLVDDYFLKYRYSFFPVADNGRYLGIVSLDHFKDLDRGSWATTRVGEVLDPEQEHPLVYPEDPAGKIYFLIMQKGISLVPVLSADGILTAVISRGDFLKIIKKMSAGV